MVHKATKKEVKIVEDFYNLIFESHNGSHRLATSVNGSLNKTYAEVSDLKYFLTNPKYDNRY